MKPVQPEELSGLLDGEIGQEREREIRAQLADDPALRAQFEALQQLDSQWRAAADTASFVPSARLPGRAVADISPSAIALLVSMLVVVRLALRWLDAPALAWTLNAVALAAVLAATILLLRAEEPGGRQPDATGG